MFLVPTSDVLCIQTVSVMTLYRPVEKKNKKKHGLISLRFPSAADVSPVHQCWTDVQCRFYSANAQQSVAASNKTGTEYYSF